MSIKNHWAVRSAGSAVALLTSVMVAAAADPQLVLDFQFNEGTGTTTTSSTEFGNAVLHLTPPNEEGWVVTSSSNSPSGKSGDMSASFESHGYLVADIDYSELDLTQAFTWEGWINPDPNDTRGRAENIFDFGGAFEICLDADGQLYVYFPTSGITMESGITVTAGEWHHYAVVYSPASMGVSFYVDGEYWNFGSIESLAYAGNGFQVKKVSLGANAIGGYAFQGNIDRVRLHQAEFYSSADMDIDAANPKAARSDTIYCWNFDEASLPYASSAKAKTLVDGLTNPVSRIDFASTTPARDIDSTLTNDFSVYIDNSARAGNDGWNVGWLELSDVDWGDTDPSFTIETWVKGLSKASGVKEVFFQSWSHPEGKFPRLAFAVSDKFTVFITTMGISDIDTGVAIPEDGGWHHIAVAYDHPNGVMNVYIDGELGGKVAYSSGVNFQAQSDSYSTWVPNLNDSNLATIGAEHTGYAPFTGNIDRLRFWKGALTADQLDYAYYGDPIIPPTIQDPYTTNYIQPTGAKVNLAPKVIGTDTEDIPMTCQWFKDGVEISGATNANYVVEVSSATAGVYTLFASNKKGDLGGEATSNGYTITLDDASFTGASTLFDFEFNEGEGVISTSEVNGWIATIGKEYQPELAPYATNNTYTQIPGDMACVFTGTGSLLGWTDLEVDLSEGFTIETWLYIDPNNDKEAEGFFSYGNSIKLGCNINHELVLTFMGVLDFNSKIIPSTGVWMHIAATWDPASAMIDFYLNGIESSSVSTENYLPPSLVKESDKEGFPYRITIGSEAGGQPTMGMLDRVRFHKGVFTADQLDYDPMNKKPLTADNYFAFDFDNGETAIPFTSTSTNPVIVLDRDLAEITSIANNLSWSNDSPTSRLDEYSVRNPGKGHYGTIPIEASALDVSNPSFTIEAWIKPDGLTKNRQIIYASDGTGRFSYWIDSFGQLGWTAYTIENISCNAPVPIDGKWHHTALSYDHTNQRIICYVDGMVSTIRSYTGGIKTDGTWDVSLIAAENYNSDLNLVGLVDGLRLHRGILHPSKLGYWEVANAVPPEITSLNIPTTLIAGQKLEMSVEAEGQGNVYQWMLNGNKIEGATNAVYTIENAETANAGLYSVVVSNDEGAITSDTGAVMIQTNPEDLVRLLEFKMDEGSGTSTVSEYSSAVATFGVETDPTLVTSVAGPSGAANDYAVSLNKNSNSYLIGDFGSDTIIDRTQPFTIEAWVYMNAADNTYRDFVRIGDSIKVGMDTTGQFTGTYLGVIDAEAGTVLAEQTWTHIAYVFNPGTDIIAYVNGVSTATTSVSGLANAFSKGIVTIGSDNGGGALFNGALDRVRIHQKALSQSELDSVANSPKGVLPETILAYDFNESSSPYLSTGTYDLAMTPMSEYVSSQSVPEWVEGPYGVFYPGKGGDYALKFSTYSSALFNTDGINFGDKEDQSFSLEAWVKDIAYSSSRQVLVQIPGNDAGTCPSVSLSIDANYYVFFTTMGKNDILTSAQIPVDSNWHHIAVAYNAPAGIYFVYVDGVMAASGSYTNGVNMTYPNWWDSLHNTGSIGREVPNSFPSSGIIDRVRLWKGVVGPYSIDYPPSEPSGEPPVQGPELEWTVEDGNLIISWTAGSLEVAETAEGPWTAVEQLSPLTVELGTSAGTQFYRLNATE